MVYLMMSMVMVVLLPFQDSHDYRASHTSMRA